uniref:Uncharacterized protein n=3 Tax=Setaria TaxID=4554 RepID=K3XMX7_SETIT
MVLKAHKGGLHKTLHSSAHSSPKPVASDQINQCPPQTGPRLTAVERRRPRPAAQLAPGGTCPTPATSPPPTMAAAGEASSKLLRFLYFVGAGVICTKAINTYRDYEHKKEASAAVAAAAAAEAALASAAAPEPVPATAAAAAAAKP